MQTIINTINSLTDWLGRSVSWLILALVLLICYDVAMRYIFQQGSVALQELEWHLFAIIFLLGSAYTLKYNEHVRVDIIYQSRFISDIQRAFINVFGIIFLLFPFCILVILATWPFVENAYFYHESSPDPGGLPYRYLLKSSIIVAFILLILQATAELLNNILLIKNSTEDN